MEVLLQRIESVNHQQNLSRLVFVGVVSQQPAVPSPHAPGQIIDSLVMTLPDADIADFKVNSVYNLLLTPKV